jgi:hypothetical protein
MIFLTVSVLIRLISLMNTMKYPDYFICAKYGGLFKSLLGLLICCLLLDN